MEEALVTLSWTLFQGAGFGRRTDGRSGPVAQQNSQSKPAVNKPGKPLQIDDGNDPKYLSSLEILKRVTHVSGSKTFFEGPAHIRAFRLAKLYLKCALNWRRLRGWHERHAAPAGSDILRRHPLFPVLTDRPYINSSWPMEKAQDVIEAHYRLIRERAPLLSFPCDEQLDLARVKADLAGLRLVLDKPSWFQNEGEIVLNLFLDEGRVYSLAFTLGYEGGKTVAYVGALQGGGRGDEALERNRLITRGAFGMRSRDLIVTAFRLLCAQLGVQRILTPMERDSVIRSAYFSNGAKQLHFKYDLAWAEYGATVSHPERMLDLPIAVPYRSALEVPSRKRAMYRRRYQMLRWLEGDIGKMIGSAGVDEV